MSSPASPTDTPAAQRAAGLMLALATLFWGSGFTWAKQGGEAVQRAGGLKALSPFGPLFLLACRFMLGAAVWLVLFPQSRRGWTWRGACRASAVGTLLAIGLIVQHLGLDQTSEAVSAFLTSLTILFVPLFMTLLLRKPPRGVLWLGVAVATVGVWLMTGATPSGFGLGELLGLCCAVAFSLYILAVNAASAHETPWRMTAGQFIVVAALCLVACAVTPGGAPNLTPRAIAHLLVQREVWQNVVLLALFATVGAFGLLTHYQPRIDPTRAALIYLIEPVVAAVYAAVAVRHYPDKLAWAGAALILIANALVELLSSRAARAEAPIVLE